MNQISDNNNIFLFTWQIFTSAFQSISAWNQGRKKTGKLRRIYLSPFLITAFECSSFYLSDWKAPDVAAVDQNTCQRWQIPSLKESWCFKFNKYVNFRI